MWKKRILSLVITTILVLSTVILVSNETVSNPGIIYVDDDGTADYTSIQEAIDNAPDGETIYVFSGIYYESLNINKNGISLIGENKYNTIIDVSGTGNGIYISDKDDISISHLTIRNAGVNGIYIVKSTSGGATENNNISNCLIYNNSEIGVFIYGWRENAQYNTIFNCDIYDNNFEGVKINHYVYYNLISNSRIYNNSRNGGLSIHGGHGNKIIGCSSYQNDGNGIQANACSIISDCISYNNKEDGIRTSNPSSTSPASILNCTCYNNSGDGIWAGGPHSIITNCVSFNNSGTGINSEGNNPLIENNKAHGNGEYGCRLCQINSFSMLNSTFYENNKGIIIDESRYGDVINCYSYANTWSGIIIDSSHDVEIDKCSSYDNYNGIILIDESYDNTVHECEIKDNSNYGIWIIASNNNLIFNNYFNNLQNGYDIGNNKWNISKTIGNNIIDGSNMGGNYWSDYPGFDLDYDGIGNTNLPYKSFGGIQNGGDCLPLVYYVITSVNVTPSSQTVNAGETFTVDITIDPAEPIAGAQFNLSFDPLLLIVNSVTEDDLFTGYTTQFDPGTIDNTNGLITDVNGVITNPGAGVSSPGTFATISFTSKNTNGISPLDLPFVLVGNPDATAVIIDITYGSVQVKNASLLPASMADEIIPYKNHLKKTPLTITTSITSTGSGIKEVALYYRYSSDNSTWNEWTQYGANKTSAPYTWLFTPPQDVGYYEFYSIAVDNSTFPEDTPLFADAMCEIYPDWDVNMDKSVNILDMVMIGQIWGAMGPPGWIPADANKDGIINVLDLIMVGQYWTG